MEQYLFANQAVKFNQQRARIPTYHSLICRASQCKARHIRSYTLVKPSELQYKSSQPLFRGAWATMSSHRPIGCWLLRELCRGTKPQLSLRTTIRTAFLNAANNVIKSYNPSVIKPSNPLLLCNSSVNRTEIIRMGTLAEPM